MTTASPCSGMWEEAASLTHSPPTRLLCSRVVSCILLFSSLTRWKVRVPVQNLHPFEVKYWHHNVLHNMLTRPLAAIVFFPFLLSPHYLTFSRFCWFFVKNERKCQSCNKFYSVILTIEKMQWKVWEGKGNYNTFSFIWLYVLWQQTTPTRTYFYPFLLKLIFYIKRKRRRSRNRMHLTRCRPLSSSFHFISFTPNHFKLFLQSFIQNQFSLRNSAKTY